jgi:hypothetical protein
MREERGTRREREGAGRGGRNPERPGKTTLRREEKRRRIGLTKKERRKKGTNNKGQEGGRERTEQPTRLRLASTQARTRTD